MATRSRTGFYFPAKLGGDDLIGINIQQPIVRAVILGEALLFSEPRPGVADSPGSCTTCYGHRVVRAAAVDDDDLVHPSFHRVDSPSDAIRFIFGNDEAGNRQSAHVTRPHVLLW